MRVYSSYTGKGDAGETGLLGGERLLKDDPLYQAVGSLEANAALGWLLRPAAVMNPCGGAEPPFDIGAELPRL